MGHGQRFAGLLALAVASLAGVTARVSLSQAAHAQSEQGVSAGSRIAGDWRSTALLTIPDSRPPLPRGSVDLGEVSGETRLNRMLLLLQPSAAQKEALDSQLANQLDPRSEEYHHWLTAAEFADTFANSAADVAAIVAWLQSAGFQVAPPPEGRGWIEFSGSAAQVEQAFQTRLHLTTARNGMRIALAGSIVVPAALRPLIHGIVSLDGQVAVPSVTSPEPLTASAAELAEVDSVAHAEALTPRLAARLLHLDTLQAGGSTGAGETIAIAARSNVSGQDVAAFRAAFGLSESAIRVVLNGADPGRNSDEAEALLSAEWAGAAAPGAQIVLAAAGSTNATDGLDLSLAAIVDQELARIVAAGFSSCEAGMSEAHQAFYAAVYRQAAAEGLTMIAAAGDSGASACQAAAADASVDSGYGVNAVASTPWNTAVGVTALADSGAAVLAGWSPKGSADPAYAGGGGPSSLYRAPAWQPLPARTGAKPMTSADSARLLPDVALPTAADRGVNPGLAFCMSKSGSASNCRLVRSGGSAGATALFAGIAAVVAGKYGPQGNIAPHLYELNRQSGVFDDVAQGNARLFCANGSPGCDAAGQIGFDAVAGYDLATGLGSVNAQKLVSAWATPQAVGTGTTSVILTVLPTAVNGTYNPSAQITFTASVSSTTGGAPPTGTVLFFNRATNSNVSATPSALDANGNATLTITSGLAQGGNNITAVYSGDATYASQSSQPVTVTIQPSTTSMTVVPSTTTPAAGSTITVVVTMTAGNPLAGTVPPSGKVTLNVDGLANSTASLVTAGGTTSATFSLVAPTVGGGHNLQAIYPGDGNYTASTSPAVSITISKGATVTALTAIPPALTAGIPETFTATIAPANVPAGTNYTITGTVNFYDGATLLGTATIASNAATLANITLSPSVLHTITAVYSGDTTWSASTSNAITLQSTLLPVSVTLAVNITTIGAGQTVTLLATVTPLSPPAANIEQNPTGNVIFYDGTTVLGTVLLTPSLNNSSTATLITGTLPGGQNVLTAYYTGDLYFAPRTSNSVTIDVEDFAITPAPTNPPNNLTIVKGSAGSASFIVTGLGGFNNQVQVVCAVPTQDDMTCQASPQQVTPTATVTFTIQTFAAGGVTTAGSSRTPWWPRAAGGAVLALLVFIVVPAGRRARLFTESAPRWIVLALLLCGLGGAGIGCSSTTTTPQNSGTPLGVATLTITATAYIDNTVINRRVYLTVNVVPPPSSASVAGSGAH
jgi:subtilase family serine protease